MNTRVFVVSTMLIMSVISLKGSPMLWESRQITYEINGLLFQYDLSAIGGRSRDINVYPPTVVHLDPGQSKIPFGALTDAPLLSTSAGKTMFGGNIRRLINPHLTIDKLPSEDKPRGDGEHIFFPANKATQTTYREINGQRWLIVTKFEDSNKQVVRDRIYWHIKNGFVTTFYLHFLKDSHREDLKWRQKRLARLEALVQGFRLKEAHKG